MKDQEAIVRKLCEQWGYKLKGTEFECREGKASEPQVGNEVLKSDIEGTRCNGNGRDDEWALCRPYMYLVQE